MIPIELQKLDRWVGVKKNSKIPINLNNGKAASSTDPDTWCSYDKANKYLQNKKIYGLGFVFNGDGIVGVDLDKGFDEDGFLSDTAIDIINKCESYTEYSQSGRGVHIILKGTLPFKGGNNRDGVEIYSTSRFFITTGNTIKYDAIIENQDAIDYICKKYFKNENPQKDVKKPISPAIYKTETKFENGRIITVYPTINEGSRHISMLSLAGQLKSKGYDKERLISKMTELNKQVCSVPLPQTEILSIIGSVLKYDN